MQERRKRMEYYIAYSVIFLLFSALIIYIFYHQGYCFVWGKDGVVIIWMMFFGVPHVRRSRKKKG